MRNKLKIILPSLLLSLLMFSNVAMASEVTGNLSTGLNSTVGNTVEGIVIVPPTASPVAGTYTSAQSVTLTASGASSIRYTTDGTIPTCVTGILYSGVIAVNSSTAIQAISCYPSNKTSTVASHLYAINIPVSGGGGGGSGGGGGGGGGGGITTPSTPTSPLSAAAQKVDANKDNKIDVLDFNSLMVNWGKTGTGNVADFDGNGKVDVFDFNLLMINWTL